MHQPGSHLGVGGGGGLINKFGRYKQNVFFMCTKTMQNNEHIET